MNCLETFETVREVPTTDDTETDETIEDAENPMNSISQDETNLINVDLKTIIKEISWFFCEKCDFRSKSKKGLRIHDVKMHSVLQKEVTEYLSRPCAWSKKDENGRTFVYYCYICGVEYNILQDGKEKAEITEHMKTLHEDAFNDNTIHCDEGLIFSN